MKRQFAIALGYDVEADLAPRVLASGEGWLARRLREIAEVHGIPLQKDGELAELLSMLPLQDEIPSELYPAVAEVFAFLYRVGKSRQGQSPRILRP